MLLIQPPISLIFNLKFFIFFKKNCELKFRKLMKKTLLWIEFKYLLKKKIRLNHKIFIKKNIFFINKFFYKFERKKNETKSIINASIFYFLRHFNFEKFYFVIKCIPVMKKKFKSENNIHYKKHYFTNYFLNAKKLFNNINTNLLIKKSKKFFK